MKAFMLIFVLLLASAFCSDPPTSYESKDAHGVSHSSHVKHAPPGTGSWGQHPKPQGPHGPHGPHCGKPKIRHVPWSHLLPVVLQPNGAVIDTPEVELAKAAHLAEHAKIKSRLHKRSISGSGGHWHGPVHIPVIKNGVPVETPEVRHAKAIHAAAHASAARKGAGKETREALYFADAYNGPKNAWYGYQQAVPFEQVAFVHSENDWHDLRYASPIDHYADVSPHGYSISFSHAQTGKQYW